MQQVTFNVFSNPTSQNKFRFSIDRGGTFTDIYVETPDKSGFKVIKLLSNDPKNYPDAPREGIRRIIEAYSESSGNTESIQTIPLNGFGWEQQLSQMHFLKEMVREQR